MSIPTIPWYNQAYLLGFMLHGFLKEGETVANEFLADDHSASQHSGRGMNVGVSHGLVDQNAYVLVRQTAGQHGLHQKRNRWRAGQWTIRFVSLMWLLKETSNEVGASDLKVSPGGWADRLLHRRFHLVHDDLAHTDGSQEQQLAGLEALPDVGCRLRDPKPYQGIKLWEDSNKEKEKKTNMERSSMWLT